ncbi:protein tumorous imaginal discs, mitochondrial [Galendromus occidentalis]|uniref:DnaJ homolog l(2)tid, mitochondrial n=1 Tax=Galendromus occidentalis TaxID=34638 RepID=A0AAJ6QK48_9ACAR|nr:protein tumorous imaginal discs, mitochondrial [Galendromus occidentalis]
MLLKPLWRHGAAVFARQQNVVSIGARSVLLSEPDSTRKFHTSRALLKRDYYEILGVARNASAKDVKKAYYQLAKKYHPDTNKGDKDAAKKFQEVSEAYEVLSDDSKRKHYDQFGTASSQGFGGGPTGGRAGSGAYQQYQYQSNIDPEELFRTIFGDFGQGRSNFDPFGAQETSFGFGRAQEVILKMSFEEAARGVAKDVTVNVADTCPKCEGSRCETGTKAQVCQFCHGTGMETISTGPFVMRSTCRKCGGTRMHIPYKCSECEGKGETVQRKTVTIPVPAGVEDGQTIRTSVGRKELFVTIRVAQSRVFKRDGSDIHSDVPVSIAQAVLGGSVNVTGIYEDIRLKISPGTSSHTKIRISGKGLKRVNARGNGDHYVNIKIEVPTSLTPEMKALMQAFAEVDKNSERFGSVGDSKSKDQTRGEKVNDKDADDGILSKIKKAIFEWLR